LSEQYPAYDSFEQERWPSALDAVRFRHFFSDCQRIAGDFAELALVTAREQHAAVGFLQAQYRDIQQNFDPSVAPFRKKEKLFWLTALSMVCRSPITSGFDR